MVTNKRIIYILLLVLFLVGCNGDCPEIKDIQGVWTNSDGSELDFRNNGTFFVKSLNITNLFHTSNSEEYLQGKVNGNGSWVIKKVSNSWGLSIDQQPWQIQMDFNVIAGKNINYSTFIIVSGSGLLENQPPWNNLFVWKEEEGGERYEFRRK